MSLTKEQKDAIWLRGKNILLAAGAGSGKTKVLIDRIISLVLNEEASVDELLIVTFTKAASAEMSSRLRTALTDELNKTEIDDAGRRNAYIRGEIDKLSTMSLSTFHSFEKSIVEENFYLLKGFDPVFRLAEEGQIQLLRDEAMEELIRVSFEKEKDRFSEFLDSYSNGRSMEDFKQLIMDVYKYILNLPDYKQVISGWASRLSMGKVELQESKAMKKLMSTFNLGINGLIKQQKQLIDFLYEKNLAGCAQEFEDKRMNLLLELQRAGTNGWEAVADAYTGKPSLQLKKIAKKKDDELTYARYEDYVKKVKDAIDKKLNALIGEKLLIPVKAARRNDRDKGMSLEQQLEEMSMLKPNMEYLEVLVLRYDEILSDMKKKEGVLEFSDLDHLTLQLLENKDVRAKYRNRYKFIFIDEYQDTNLIQEKVMQLICRENNMFMVGDIKQSIYKFRQAEPEIFKEKYDTFKAMDADDNSQKLDLNKNFRSRSSILNYCNQVFDGLMDGYDEDAKLKPGMSDEAMEEVLPTTYSLVKDDADENIPKEEKIATIDMNVMERSKAYKEGQLVSKIIGDYLGREFFDRKMGCMRSLELGDIAILSRKMSTYGSEVYNGIRDSGIPVVMEERDDFLSTLELRLFTAMLAIINNIHLDHELMTVMRSPSFGFTLEEMTRIRIGSPRGSFARAVLAVHSVGMALADDGIDEEIEHAQNEGKSSGPKISEIPDEWDDTLIKKTTDFINQIHSWKRLSYNMDVSSLAWIVLNESGLYAYAGAMELGAQRQANLMALVEMALSLETSGRLTLFDFVRYLKKLKQNMRVNIEQSRLLASSGNAVRMMTIHKSKGLEFPMVILIGLDNQLDGGGRGNKVSIHKDIGIDLKLVDLRANQQKNTLLSRLVKSCIEFDEWEEALRILYVALTRTTTFLAMTHIQNDRNVDTYRSKIDWPAGFPNIEVYEHELPESSPYITYKKSYDVEKDEILTAPITSDLKLKVEELLNFKYEHIDKGNLQSKYSVTQLNRLKKRAEITGQNDEGDYIVDIIRTDAGETAKVVADDFATAKINSDLKESISKASMGSAYHKIVEKLDFKTLSNTDRKEEILNIVEKTAKELVFKGTLDENQVAAVDFLKIVQLFTSPLGQDMIAAAVRGELWKERPFVLSVEEEDEAILLQGIIDCFYIHRNESGEETFVLVDYKSNSHNRWKSMESFKSYIQDTYKTQMAIYKRAIEEAYDKKVSLSCVYLFSSGEIVEFKDK